MLKILYDWLKKKTACQIIAVTIFTTVFNLTLYTIFELRGNLRYLPLAGEYFGLPPQLQSKDIKPFYTGKSVLGWDGQFYFYIANDPLDQKGTAQHIDSPPYRYQRIGLSLIPYTISKIFNLDWVSPELFLICYFTIFIVGLMFASKVCRHYRLSQWWVLAWGLFATTQVTLFNFLPDAAADIFLLISFYLLFAKENLAFFAILGALCVLSREIYIILYLGVFLNELFINIKAKSFKIKRLVALSLPGACFIIWQTWCTWHFQKTPGSMALGVIGVPIFDWLRFTLNAHTVVDSIAMLSFFSLIIYQFYLSVRLMKKYQQFIPLIFCSMTILFLYLSFGPTVLNHWTGYLKPAAIFTLSIPLCLSFLGEGWTKPIKILFSLFLLSSLILLYVDRLVPFTSSSVILAGLDRDFANQSSAPKDVDCMPEQLTQISVSLEHEEAFYENDTLLKTFHLPYLSKIKFKLTNNSSLTRPIAQEKGDIKLGYRFINLQTNETIEGRSQSPLPISLEAYKSEFINLAIKFPSIKGRYKLIVSPLQSDCFWFYEKASHSFWERIVNIQ